MFRILSHFVHCIGTVLLIVGIACQVCSVTSTEWIVHKLTSDNGLSYFEGGNCYDVLNHRIKIFQVCGIGVQFKNSHQLFNGLVGIGKARSENLKNEKLILYLYMKFKPNLIFFHTFRVILKN